MELEDLGGKRKNITKEKCKINQYLKNNLGLRSSVSVCVGPKDSDILDWIFLGAWKL